MRTAGLLAAGLAVAGLAVPQEAQPDQTFRATVNVVVAPTLVTDHAGNVINGLQPQDFILTDNGKPQDIKVDVTYIPISLVVAIQANSTAEPVLPKIQKIGPLLTKLVVGDQGEVAVVAFDHRFQVLQDFTSDTDKVEAALKKLKPGSTEHAMVEAVIDSARMLNRRPQDHRRILLLISETRDMGSGGKVREALEDLQFDNVVVYTVNINRFITTLLGKPQPPRPDPFPIGARPLPGGVPPTPEASRQVYGNPGNSANFVPLFVEIFKQVKAIFVDNPVEVFTKYTGGKERSFVTERDLEDAISNIGAEVHSEYLLSYKPNNKEEGGFHDIAVAIRNHPEYKVRTRPGYWIASRPAGSD